MKMKAGFALLLAVAGCSSARDDMLEQVKARLKDPDSARFSDVEIKKSERGYRTVLCGVVSAKNGFGGYGDAQPFAVVRVEASQAMTVSFDASCRSASLNADMMDSVDYAREVLAGSR